jgi:hypothetical protein
VRPDPAGHEGGVSGLVMRVIMDAPEAKPGRGTGLRFTPRLLTQVIMFLALAAVLIYILTDKPAPERTPDRPAGQAPLAEGDAGLPGQTGMPQPSPGLATTEQDRDEVVTGPSIFPDSALLEWKREKNFRYQPAQTPAEAYATMMAAFAAEGAPRDIPFDRRQKSRPYEILQNYRRAVAYFGERRNVDSQPYLFARTREGWIFDYINQVRLILYDRGNLWKVAFGDDEYQALFDQRRFSGSAAFDIPWTGEDVYYPENDRKIVQRIFDLERALAGKPDDFEKALEAARLGIMVRRPLSAVIPRLDQAKALAPDDARPYFYAAAACLGRVYDPRRAKRELEEGLKRDPRSLFGRRLLGYLSYVLNDSNAAIALFRDVLQEAPSDCYASVHLGQALLQRLRTRRSDEDKQGAIEALGTAFLHGCGPRSRRAADLWDELKRSRLLEQARFGLSLAPQGLGGRREGVLVIQVEAGQAAARAGLEAGDFIVTFDGRAVHGASEWQYFSAAVQPGREVRLGILRGALDEPLTLPDGSEVAPRTSGLHPPREIVLAVTPDRKDRR